MGATVTAAAITAGAMLFGSKKQDDASKRATIANTNATREAQRLEEEAEKARRNEFDVTQRDNMARWEAEQKEEQSRFNLSREDALRQEAQDNARYAYTEKGRLPYRDTGRAALNDLATRAGLTIRPSEPPPDMAAGWTPEQLTPSSGPSPSTRPPSPLAASARF